jgi:signal transduction histidine kinase
LSNAIKFSLPDGEVVVTVANKEGTDLVRISVRDHGPGISVDFRPRVFERFAQADATNARRKGGTGLGLSIVKEIVDRFGGEVGFDDAPGGGTVFHVELPVWRGIADALYDVSIPDTSIASRASRASLLEAARIRLTRVPAASTEEAV